MKSVAATSIYITWRQPIDVMYNQTTFSIFYHSVLNQKTSRKETSTIKEFNITGLLPATLYAIHVVAINAYFKGGSSNQIIQRTNESGME